jgi:hypothetical protein
MGWKTEGSENESRWGQEFSFLHSVQTGSGAHPTSHPINTGNLSPGVKRPRHEADHSPPAIAEVKKMWIYTSTPPYAFMAYFTLLVYLVMLTATARNLSEQSRNSKWTLSHYKPGINMLCVEVIVK